MRLTVLGILSVSLLAAGAACACPIATPADAHEHHQATLASQAGADCHTQDCASDCDASVASAETKATVVAGLLRPDTDVTGIAALDYARVWPPPAARSMPSVRCRSDVCKLSSPVSRHDRMLD